MKPLLPGSHLSSYRWFVLFTMCVAIGTQSGIRLAFGVFDVTLREDFGWRWAVDAGGRGPRREHADRTA